VESGDKGATAPDNVAEEDELRPAQIILRAFLVTVSVLLGIVIPDFGFLLALIGALTGALLTLTIPCCLHLKICKGTAAAFAVTV
jgi:hypothetical protein